MAHPWSTTPTCCFDNLVPNNQTTNWNQRERLKVKTIAAFSQKGGSGKTTIALHLWASRRSKPASAWPSSTSIPKAVAWHGTARVV